MISGQTTGYIVIDGKKTLVLARATYNKKYHYGYTSLKKRWHSFCEREGLSI